LFDRADSVTYAGGISGSGAIAQLGGLVLTSATGSTSGITQTGTGTLTLTGANTFTGGALVANGTLDVEGSLVSSVVVGGIGPGTSITTSNGVFQVGQNTSSTNYGAILAGAGSVGSVSVASGGMVMPGSPAARTALAAGTPTTAGTTLTVAGNLALSSGSTLAIFASPTQNTSLAVTGAATIGGALTVMTSGTIAGGTKDAIITAAGGISGAFTSLTINGAQGQLTSLSTSGNTEYVTFGSSAPVVVATPPATAVAQVVAAAATTPNTSSVGTSLALNPNSTLGKAVATLTPAQATNVLNSLSGEGNVSSQTAGQGATRTFTNFIGDRSAPGESNNNSGTVQVSGGGLPAGVSQYAPVEPQVVAIVVDKPKPTPLYRVFATGFGGFNNTAAQGATTAAENGSFYGGLMGIDYRVQPNVLIGAAAGGSTTNFQVPARSSSGNTTGFNGNVFAVVSFGPWYGQSLTTLSTFSNTTTRNIAGFGSGANAVASAIEQASFGSFEVRTRAEFGRVTPIPNTIKGFETFKITPFVALELAQLKTDGYSEYNASGGPNTDGLTAASRTYADVRSFLGARLETSYDAGNGITLRPIARLSYVHAFSPAPTSINSFQSVPGATFTVSGAPVAHNSAETKVGAEADLGHGTVIFVNFEGNFSTVEQIYGGRGGIRYSW
jgi:outer membrane autotransporter protein